MESIAQDLWVQDSAMTVLGGPLRLRTTIAKLADGTLWVHSPTRLTDDFKAELDDLGPVSYIVGPNNVHNIYLERWATAYPDAQVYVSDGIPAKLPNLKITGVLGQQDRLPWSDTLEHICLQGVPFFSETVFLHKASRSLIVTDLVQNHVPDPNLKGWAGLARKLVLRPLGFKGIVLAPILKFGKVKNKAAFSASLSKVNAWDFERILIAHGPNLTDNVKPLFDRLSQKYRS